METPQLKILSAVATVATKLLVVQQTIKVNVTNKIKISIKYVGLNVQKLILKRQKQTFQFFANFITERMQKTY